MRRTQEWVNRVVEEGHAEVEWQTRGTVTLRWAHANRKRNPGCRCNQVVTVWVVKS